jgi:hypothetical protein
MHMRTNGPGEWERLEAQKLDLRIGELVEVRSESEILTTLDEQGRLDALPFMPEMLQFSGKRFRVYKRAIKACDTIGNTGMLRMENAVHLESVRCDGQAHGGCQAGCLIYWKEGWLKRVEPDASPPAEAAADTVPPPAVDRAPAGAPPCTVATLMRATRIEASDSDPERFSCQATELPRAAPKHIAGWDLRQYVQDVTSGNAHPLPTIRGLLIHLFNKYQVASRRFLSRRLLIHGGDQYPFLQGRLEGKTPKELLGLQPGELVEVKSKEEILQTLDKTNRNRGLRFDVEMLKYCGKRARVLRQVSTIVDEKTGEMMQLPNDCVILDGVICEADYHQYCPRSIYPYWREIWLRRVG